MTEERKKKLAETTTLVLTECDFNASKELAVVTKLIEIVAAEAREEGRIEGIDEAAELASLDAVLARREAIDSLPNRMDKILHAINEAKKVQPFEADNRRLQERVENCHDYLMSIERSKITAEDTLESLGFTRDGLNESQALQHKEGE